MKRINVLIQHKDGIWHCFTGSFTGYDLSVTALSEREAKNKMVQLMAQYNLRPIFPEINKI